MYVGWIDLESWLRRPGKRPPSLVYYKLDGGELKMMDLHQLVLVLEICKSTIRLTCLRRAGSDECNCLVEHGRPNVPSSTSHHTLSFARKAVTGQRITSYGGIVARAPGR